MTDKIYSIFDMAVESAVSHRLAKYLTTMLVLDGNSFFVVSNEDDDGCSICSNSMVKDYGTVYPMCMGYVDGYNRGFSDGYMIGRSDAKEENKG